MFRKSALAMAMLSALTTADVVALGLGEIELKSALNQPLIAEVELLSATPEELQELKVEVGSPQAFASAGIERTLFLNKLKFDVKTNAEGRPVVKITSRDAVREPFLDFLLEISWSKGRLLREYTVLVDPPVTMPAAAPAPQVPSARPATSGAPAAAAGRVTHTAQLPPLSTVPGEYLTQRNDTLWQVAQQLRPDADVSIEQTMLGLLRTNPDAFYNNNINELKAGYILRVPDREELTRISRTEAAREARRQYAEWREARNLVAPTEAPAQAAAPQAQGAVESSLQLVAPDLSEGGAQGGSAEDGAGLEALQHDLMIANEALEAQRRQGEEMSTRLSVLEEQIQNMQRLIQLKDDELARLQAQVGEEMSEPTAGEAEPVTTETEAAEPLAGPDAVGDQPVAEAVAEATVAEATVAEEAVAEEAVAEEAVAEPAPGADVAGAGVDSPVDAVLPEGELAGEGFPASDSLPAEESVGDAPMEAVPEQSAVEPVPAPEPLEVAAEPAVPDTFTSPGFVDKLLANPLWLGAGAVLLAIAGFLGLRRKRGSETEFQESILQAAREKSSAGSDSEIIRSQPESGHSTTTASSLLSEFAVSDMGSMKHDGEADPLAEADVYLAYGRFQQAEDLIKDALQSKPEQEDLNLKLLEVYLAARNSTAFDAHAQEVLGRLEDSEDPVWEKIAEMGRELSPHNPLYQPRGRTAPEVPEHEQLASADMAMDAPASEEHEAQGFAEEAPDLGEEPDFDTELSFDSGEVADESKPDSVEFTPPEPVAEKLQPAEADLAELDSGEPATLDLGADNALEFDLEGLDLGGDEELEPPGDGELTDLDEVSTKLDLARAYLDMGDPDGARSILGEVIEEGSDDQKSEAQEILEKIA
jgi:pilus assembly protein FimV